MSRRYPTAAALCVLAATAVAATRAQAQQQITVGQSIVGQLTMSDLIFTDGARYDMYVFFGQAGQYVQIDMVSSDLDAYLILQDQNGRELTRNDDGGGGLNARIQTTLAYAGQYRIIAKSFGRDRYGTYTLSLTGGAMQPVVAAPGGMLGMIGANQQVTGNLTAMDARHDGKPHQAWGFSCTAGQSFQMDILSSWDNYALVFDAMGAEVARNDDGGEGLNARINHTCTSTGVHRLIVTTYSTSTTPGPYTLQVQAMAPMAMAQPTPIPQPVPMQPTPMPTPTPQAMPGATLPAPSTPAIPTTGSIPAPGTIGQIQVGQNTQGRLESGDRQMNDGSWADVWQFQGRAGQAVVIELRSDEFDTFLQLLDAQGNPLAEDDDSLGDRNSRIRFTLPSTGMYQIVVNNFGEERRTGIYTLSLR